MDIDDTNITENIPEGEVPAEPEIPAEPEVPVEPEAVEPSEPAAAAEAQEVAAEPSAVQEAPEPPARPVAAAPSTKYYGTGHRKNAMAKVWLSPGTGTFNINKLPLPAYLHRKALEILVIQPLVITDFEGRLNVDARVQGGGIAGQAGAIRHGIAKALLEIDPDLRSVLRRAGFLTRDPRVKERKKYGRRRARRAFQFTKR